MGVPRHGEASFVDDFLLPEHWCFHIYSYHAILELDGVPYSISPGYASVIPPNTRMVYRYKGPSEHVYFHFRDPGGELLTEFATIFDLGEHYNSMDDRARKAVGRTLLDAAYPVATLWSLLCEASDHQAHLGESPHGNAIVAAAIRHIEQRLAEPLSVAQLCVEVGVSYGYVTRLFKHHLGLSVMEYVRTRRANQAEHLIRSTTLPIKTIARNVGVPDLGQFNRLMRQMKGLSPRSIRRQEYDQKVRD